MLKASMFYLIYFSVSNVVCLKFSILRDFLLSDSFKLNSSAEKTSAGRLYESFQMLEIISPLKQAFISAPQPAEDNIQKAALTISFTGGSGLCKAYRVTPCGRFEMRTLKRNCTFYFEQHRFLLGKNTLERQQK